MKLSRSEAISLSSFIKFINLDEDELYKIKEVVLSEFDDNKVKEWIANRHIRRYILIIMSIYSNGYLKYFLEKHLTQVVQIYGNPPLLYPCRCCGYKTLEEKDEYFICKVCHWEDDGIRDENIYSDANRMTLRQARNNFVIIGSINENALRFLDEDRFLQFDTQRKTVR